jgi:hypothetical protein
MPQVNGLAAGEGPRPLLNPKDSSSLVAQEGGFVSQKKSFLQGKKEQDLAYPLREYAGAQGGRCLPVRDGQRERRSTGIRKFIANPGK